MIIKQKITGFVQQCTPRKKFDEQTRRYTNDPELSPTGEPRYNIILAVPGERESLRLTATESDLYGLSMTPESLEGQIISVAYTAKVELSWAKVENMSIFQAEG